MAVALARIVLDFIFGYRKFINIDLTKKIIYRSFLFMF